MDHSTINIKELKRLPRYTVPPTYHVDRDSGNACYLDPPGYPTYFTRAVYTGYGNYPSRSACQVISLEGVHYITLHALGNEDYEKHAVLMRKIWKPLSLDHPRTRAWIGALYRQSHHCYKNPLVPKSWDAKDMLIWPVPDWQLIKFEYDSRFSDEWREKEKAATEQANREIIEQARAVAIPKNHSAVLHVREFYPEYEPELDLIETPPSERGDWWETEAERPTPENCKPRSMGKHPLNNSWCQWCGWESA